MKDNGNEKKELTITSPKLQSEIQQFQHDQRVCMAYVQSGFFKDVRDVAQAIVKLQAGRELGFSPIASLTGIFIVKDKVTVSANLIAAAIKRSGHYTYRIKVHTDDRCVIEFFEKFGDNFEPIGTSEFALADAERAGIAKGDNWRNYPRNMLFARALSNGAKWHCPDIFGGPIYTPDELGAKIDGESGDVIEIPKPASTFGPKKEEGTAQEQERDWEEIEKAVSQPLNSLEDFDNYTIEGFGADRGKRLADIPRHKLERVAKNRRGYRDYSNRDFAMIKSFLARRAKTEEVGEVEKLEKQALETANTTLAEDEVPIFEDEQ